MVACLDVACRIFWIKLQNVAEAGSPGVAVPLGEAAKCCECSGRG